MVPLRMSNPHHPLEDASASVNDLTPEHTHCANCGAELEGPFCHQCGQSTRDMLKHLPALTADMAEAFFGLDGRLMHTLPALYFKPGFLAREYFAGRRVRYIPPFKLMFFMSVLAFLLIHLALNLDSTLLPASAQIQAAATPTAVHSNMQQALARIDKARANPKLPDVGQLALGLTTHAIPTRANRRLHELGATPLPAASVPAPPSTTALAAQLNAIARAPSKAAVNDRANRLSTAIAQSEKQLAGSSMLALVWLNRLNDSTRTARQQGLARIEGTPVSAGSVASPSGKTGVPQIGTIKIDLGNHPHVSLGQVHVAWLPTFVETFINAGLAQAQANIKAMASGSSQSRNRALRHVLGDIVSVTPQTLFVLIPVLALLLKLMYAFTSRLYIEHLIVALYSHAFIFLTLFISVLVGLIVWALPSWAGIPGAWVQTALWIWLPVHLLMMQKRIYAQGWTLTVVKYGCTGVGYSILLLFALTIAVLIGLAS